MSSIPPSPDPPLNHLGNPSNPPSPRNSDMINDSNYLHPHTLPITTFTHPANCGQPHDTLKQTECANGMSWTPSLHQPSQPKRHSRKSKRPHAEQQQSRRPPKTSATLPTYGENVDHMEKSTATVAVNRGTHSKGDRQHEKHMISKEAPLEGFWYCHRGCLLLCIFFFILVLGFLLFLVWPRVPLLRIEGASVVSPVEIVQTQQGWMENVMFTTSWLVNVTVDNRQNYIPTRLNKVQLIVKDAVTNALVGKGTHNDDNMDWVLMDGISTMSLLVTVNYQARDMSDTTFLDLAHACHRTAADLPATSLPLHFWFTLYMFGFDWLGFTPTIIATPASSGFFCPV
ncbi:hypothetical protein BCR42DRAFT_405615 [Absidia repens]|uniref:Uncharacterized protein n=1 Tax=Absidia repens TaxID=90262 RepID=A0A1X2ITN5_9FUNG|nr:hypothetical protein BCR42DRAFT_405615 [Absidia repens]